MADIFFSYAREDRERVAPIVGILEHAGFSVWWDRHTFLGEPITERTQRELNQAKCVIVAWSSSSISSQWVLDEARRAKRREILAPLILDNVEPPLSYGDTYTVDLSGWAGDPADPRIAELIAGARRISAGTHESSGGSSGFPERPVPWSSPSPVIFREHPKVLAVGSHIDDIWLGCSATLMLLGEKYHAQIVCSDLCDNYPYPYFGKYRIRDQVHSDLAKLCASLGFKAYDRAWKQRDVLTDRKFPSCLDALSRRVEYLSSYYGDADLIFVPRHDDYHEDHALTTRELLKEFRRSMVLEYEIKEFRRSPFHPSLLVDVSAKSNLEFLWNGNKVCETSISFAEKKAIILGRIFPDILQADDLPITFSKENVLGRLSIRAEEAGPGVRFVEAFVTDHIIR